jgi:hypothetical protein
LFLFAGRELRRLAGEPDRECLPVRASAAKTKLEVAAAGDDLAGAMEAAGQVLGGDQGAAPDAVLRILFSDDEAEVVGQLGAEELCADAIARRLGMREASTRFKLMLSHMASRGVLRSNRHGYVVGGPEVSKLAKRFQVLQGRPQPNPARVAPKRAQPAPEPPRPRRPSIMDWEPPANGHANGTHRPFAHLCRFSHKSRHRGPGQFRADLACFFTPTQPRGSSPTRSLRPYQKENHAPPAAPSNTPTISC